MALNWLHCVIRFLAKLLSLSDLFFIDVLVVRSFLMADRLFFCSYSLFCVDLNFRSNYQIDVDPLSNSEIVLQQPLNFRTICTIQYNSDPLASYMRANIIGIYFDSEKTT